MGPGTREQFFLSTPFDAPAAIPVESSIPVSKGIKKVLEPAEKAAARTKERRVPFTTISGRPIEPLYKPEDIAGLDYGRDLANPGQFPYTRGVHETMYRGKMWTMRQFAGFGSAAQTNARFKYLLQHGVHGLSVAFDLPTLMGRDPDHALSLGEVGKCGVAITSLADMETLFEGIPLDDVSTSMTINSPAAMLLAFYVIVGEKQGVPPEKLTGTVQADILKEFIAQKEYIFPPRPSMRVIVDMIRYCTDHMPRWNSISISGYHIREAGSTAAQELAFTLRDGIEYVQWCVDAGMDVDSFAPRLSFFFNSHSDFFEEIAKFRAARRIWARTMKERFGAKNPRSLMCRFHTQTAGVSLTAQQPYNNVVRTALQGLAAVLGGTQSLHTNSLDEALALPTEEAVTIALRTQQIIAHESGVVNTADPLGGSYFVEKLTNDIEAEALEYFRKIDALGGMVAAVERGFPQREIQEAAFQFQKAVEAKDKIIVGVNDYVMDEQPFAILYIDESVAEEQTARVAALRATRDNEKVRAALAGLQEAARGTANIMYPILDASRAYATLGEMCDALREVWGEYEEPPVF
jgi:methylmalonyl-CoA mutase N-terminal domain/subunit